MGNALLQRSERMVFLPGGVPVAAGQHDRVPAALLRPAQAGVVTGATREANDRRAIPRRAHHEISPRRGAGGGFHVDVSGDAGRLRVRAPAQCRNPELLVVIGGSSCESPAGDELVSGSPISTTRSGSRARVLSRFVGHVMEGNVGASAGIAGLCARRPPVPAAAYRSTRLPMADETGGRPAAACVGEARDINAPLPLDYAVYSSRSTTTSPNTPSARLCRTTSRGCWWGEMSHCTFSG